MSPTDNPPTAGELDNLTRQLAGRGRGITNQRVLDAVLRVPRHLFVPDELRAEAYADCPLPIGHGQTISQPFIVAYMTAAIDPQPNERILEIGAGCGYQTAILAHLAREVFAIEIVEPLAARARSILTKLGLENAHIRNADGWFGWSDQAPFDAILVACSPARIPAVLIDQLKPEGRMILPVGDLYQGQELVLVEKTARGVVRQSVMPVRFVPMTGRAESE